MPINLINLGGFLIFISILLLNIPSLGSFDLSIIKYLSHHRIEILNTISLGLSVIGNTISVLFITMLCVIYMSSYKKYIGIAFYLIAIVGSIVIAWSLKYLVAIPRPPAYLQMVESFGASYPSAHSLYAATLGSLLIYTNLQHPKYKVFILFALLWICMMGISRLYLGVHFPSDVLSGWGIGLIWTSLLYLIFIKYCGAKNL